MFWRYMADKKLIDVKPTRKEILYGFFCTGISLVLLIIFGITIVIFANKYMQNMKGNQNYLENLSLTTTTEETTATTTPSELFIFVNDDNDNENEYYLSTKMTTTNEINAAATTTTITPKILTETMKTKEKISSFEITDNNKRIKVQDLVTTEIPLAEQNDDNEDDDGGDDDDDEDDDDGMMVATTATLVKHRIDFETPELLLTSGEGISSDLNGIDYSEMKIEEITKSDLKKFYRINNESIDKNVS